MLISKWLKKYDTKNYRFVTFQDNSQALIVDDGNNLSTIDVKTGKEISCFGHDYIAYLNECIFIKEKNISLLKAKTLAKKYKLYKKYEVLVAKAKEYDVKTGNHYRDLKNYLVQQ